MTRPYGRTEIALLLAVAAVAAWLRFADLDHIPFGDDAAQMLRYADRMAAGEFVLTGIPSSKGILNPPLAVYIIALLRTVMRSPQALGAATAVGGMFALVVAWWTARRFFGRTEALVTAVLFAVSAWAVFYSRAIWNQDFVPPLGSLFLLSLLLWAVEGRVWALGLALALAGAASQLHLTCFAWFVVIGAVAVALKAPLKWKPIAAGSAACALLYAPFAAAWIMRGTLDTTPGALRPSALFHSFRGKPLFFALESTTHGALEFQYTQLSARFLDGMPLVARLLIAIVPWIAAALVVAGFARSMKDRRVSPAAMVLLIMTGLPIAAMLLSGLSAAPHYAIVIFPGPWLLAGIGVTALAARGPAWRWAVATAVAVVAVVELGFVVSLKNWVARDPGHAGDDSPPLMDQVSASRFIAGDAKGEPVEVRSAPNGPPVGENYRWLIEEAGGNEGAQAIYVLVFQGLPLSAEAQAAMEAHGARRFGALEVCRWR